METLHIIPRSTADGELMSVKNITFLETFTLTTYMRVKLQKYPSGIVRDRCWKLHFRVSGFVAFGK